MTIVRKSFIKKLKEERWKVALYKNVLVTLLTLMAAMTIESSAIAAEAVTIYYVDATGGNDTNDGLSEVTAWKTISKVNGSLFSPGDKILFKRGEMWRETLIPHIGSTAGYITYGAYGTGNKPLLLGSVSKNNVSDWTNETGNIWVTDGLEVDVGNLIFNNEESVGIKVRNESELDAQGKFWYDRTNLVLKLYSETNPAIFYSNIECALARYIINLGGRSYNIFENLDLRYGGSHGFGGGGLHHIIIRDCDLSYIGGARFSGTTRYGNGIEFWGNAHDTTVERCTLSEIYDAALTTQGSGTNQKYNQYFRNNIIWNAGYCFEYHNGPTTSSTSNIYFENNTCAYSGYGWGSVPQGRPWSGSHIMSWGNTASISNFYIRNNIFYEAMDRGFKLAGGWTEEALGSLFINNNIWYDSSDVPIDPYTPPWNFMIWYCRSYSVGCTGYSMATFWQYKADTGKDADSIATDPLFIDELNNNFHPILGSHVCTMSNTGSFVGALPCDVYPIKIDIKPGSYLNNINAKSKGKIKVAILSTEDFDATTVDPLSVAFGPFEGVEVNGTGQIYDADDDGDLDLILQFYTQETGIACGENEAGLIGETFDGLVIEGFDSINVVKCN